MSSNIKAFSKLSRHVFLIFALIFVFVNFIGCTGKNGTSIDTGTGTGTGTGVGTSTGTSTGTGTGTGTATAAASVSNLVYSPIHFFTGSAGSTTPIAGTVDFADVNSDVSTLRIDVFNSSGTKVDTVTQDSGVSGQASGTINFIFNVDCSRSLYTFQVWVVDSANLASNVLTGDLTGSAPTAPQIGNLAHTPSEIVQEGGGGAYQVTGSMNFLDNDADVSTVTISVFNNAGTLVSTVKQDAGVSGTSGAINFIFYVDSSIATADYSFQVYATDSAGLASNVLAGNGNPTGIVNSPPLIGNFGLQNHANPAHNKAAKPGEGGGEASFDASIDFQDTEKKVSNVMVEVFDDVLDPDWANPIVTLNTPAGVFGTERGTINFQVFIPTTTVTRYYITASVLDTDNLVSNELAGPVNVGFDRPTISDLSFSPTIATIIAPATSVAVSITGNITFSHYTGNLAYVIVKVTDPNNQTVYSNSSAAGTGTAQYGKVDFTANFTATIKGAYNLSVTVEDDIGMTPLLPLPGIITVN
jgi:hypothetical protein